MHLNLDKTLGRAKNRIYLIGVELEGGWKKLPDEGLELHHDGSVQFPTEPVTDAQLFQMQLGQRQRPVNHGMLVGEIPSPIMEPAKMAAWVTKYHPHHVNKTCGLHVHMSFKSAQHYDWLMEKSYQDTVIEYLARWAKENAIPAEHCIWERLAGKSEYCKLDFNPDIQVRGRITDRKRAGHRYTAINYCHAEHGTLECRVLPMLETAKLSVSAVKRVLDITNACLLVQARKEKKLSAEVEDDGGVIREFREIPLSRAETRDRRSVW